ncbi:MAG: electron transfer flavoprotein subunit alpha/FixB family protein [Ignavibacteriaceae bacterium]
MAKKLLAFLEQREGKLKRAAFEVVSVASRLSKDLNLGPEALIIGNDVANINDITKYGIKKIIHFKNDSLTNYSTTAYSEIISNYAKETGADYLIFSNTALGKDLAPHIAVQIDAGILVDCTKLDVSGDEVIATRPIYAGKALLNLKLKSEKKIYTIRPNVFKPTSSENNAAAEIEEREIGTINNKTRVVEIKKSEGKLDVAEADIIVSGGRGLKGSENFHLVEELAESFGAAVGASRAVVDAGWRPHREQVGQTGKTVSPTLYVACGISGAIQHLAGMSSSKYIVAINKDKDAPIFSVADFGITGDAFEILPALTEEIKKIKSQ